MLTILWIISIIASLYFTRLILKIDSDFFDDSVGFLIFYTLFIFIPIVNLFISLAVLLFVFDNDYSVGDFLKKIFFIKDDDKKTRW
jgi:hypothetical protein